jgi:phosphoribosylanthranilate isomerase
MPARMRSVSSPRCCRAGPIPDAKIAEIAALVPPPIATFLLTSESTAEAISAHVRRTHTTAVQIVSPIDPAKSARIAALEPHVCCVQVIHVEGHSALEPMTAERNGPKPSR